MSCHARDETYHVNTTVISIANESYHVETGTTLTQLTNMTTETSLNEYSHLYIDLYCQIWLDQNFNSKCTDLVTAVLAKYHVSKGMKILKRMTLIL